MLKINPEGRRDPAFGSAGVAFLPEPGYYSDFAAVPGTEKLVVAGLTRRASEGSWLLVRLNADGSIDGTFGNGGTIVPGIRGTPPRLLALPDGKLVAEGENVVARFEGDGRPDAAFGRGTGVVQLPFRVGTIGASPGGGMYVSGVRSRTMLVARLAPSGELDRTFGTNGIVSVSFGGGRVSTGFSQGVAPSRRPADRRRGALQQLAARPSAARWAAGPRVWRAGPIMRPGQPEMEDR